MAREYQECLVAYIDVLGFRELIERSANDKELVGDIDDQLAEFIKWLAEFGLQGRFHAYNFSDHTVRATEIHPKDDLADHLNREAYYIAERQLQLAMKGWFIRGAISIGLLATSEHTIFGPALVSAYGLESTIAVYPRVVIDPTVLGRLENAATATWHDYLFMDRDGITSVDYVFGAFLRRWGHPDRSERDPWKVLDDHRRACMNFLESEKALRDLRVRQKAVWTCEYHNGVLLRLAKRFAGRDEATQFHQYRVEHRFLARIDSTQPDLVPMPSKSFLRQ